MKKSITILSTTAILVSLAFFSAEATSHAASRENTKANVANEETLIPNQINWTKAVEGLIGMYTNTYSFRWKEANLNSENEIEAYIYPGDSFSWKLSWDTPGVDYGYKMRSASSNNQCLQANDKYAVEENKLSSGNVTANVNTNNCSIGDWFSLTPAQKIQNNSWTEEQIFHLGISIKVHIVAKPDAPEITKHLTDKTIAASENCETDNFDFSSNLSAPFQNHINTIWTGKVNGEEKSKEQLQEMGFSFTDNSYTLTPTRAANYSISATVEVPDIILSPENANPGAYHLKSTITSAHIAVLPNQEIKRIDINPLPEIENNLPLYDNANHCAQTDNSLCPIYTRHLGTADDNIITYVNLRTLAYDQFGNPIQINNNINYEAYLCNGNVNNNNDANNSNANNTAANCSTTIPIQVRNNSSELVITPDSPTSVWKIVAKAPDETVYNAKYITVQGGAKNISPRVFHQRASMPASQDFTMDVYPAPYKAECESPNPDAGITITHNGKINTTNQTAAGVFSFQNCKIWNALITNADENLKHSENVNFTIIIDPYFEPTLKIIPEKKSSKLTEDIQQDTVTFGYEVTDTYGNLANADINFSSSENSDIWDENVLTVTAPGVRSIYATGTIEGHEINANTNYTVLEEKKPQTTIFNILDMDKGSAEYSSVEQMYERGYTAGCWSEIERNIYNTKYCPNDIIKRQQMAAFLYRFSNSPDFTPPMISPFRDLKTDNIFYKYIMWGANFGIWAGYDNGEFGGNKDITRGQMVSVLYRLAGSPEVQIPKNSPFKDLKNSHWAYKAIIWAANNNITTGYTDNTFRPDEKCKRSQMAILIIKNDDSRR
ncbi:MAG: S-layer homology domain-containing protein [Bifidobacteriaceae bacterium]|jgi:hypothetical protein|nr:S-layer homology domain-containing protein [Bifidobacteriaceae bacterium]